MGKKKVRKVKESGKEQRDNDKKDLFVSLKQEINRICEKALMYGRSRTKELLMIIPSAAWLTTKC